MATVGSDDVHSRTTRLAFHSSSVTRARELVTCDLEARGTDRRVVQDVNVVVGELVANGVGHGSPTPEQDVEVSWSIHADRLVVTVHDGGWVDHLSAQMPGPDAPRGRGLAMVAMLAERWSWDADHGTRVTAEMRLDQLHVLP